MNRKENLARRSRSEQLPARVRPSETFGTDRGADDFSERRQRTGRTPGDRRAGQFGERGGCSTGGRSNGAAPRWRGRSTHRPGWRLYGRLRREKLPAHGSGKIAPPAQSHGAHGARRTDPRRYAGPVQFAQPQNPGRGSVSVVRRDARDHRGRHRPADQALRKRAAEQGKRRRRARGCHDAQGQGRGGGLRQVARPGGKDTLRLRGVRA